MKLLQICLASVLSCATALTTVNPGTDCQSGTIASFFIGETGVTFLYEPNPTDYIHVNAQGGGIIKDGGIYYLHGEFFQPNATDTSFQGVSMYASDSMSRWTNKTIILPPQRQGELGPHHRGERPHIIKCPSTGEYVLFAHSESIVGNPEHKIVYATSKTVDGTYAFKGALKDSKGVEAKQLDVNVLMDGSTTYVVANGGNVYKLATDCHSWVSHSTYPTISGSSGGAEAPVVVKVNGTYYWISSQISNQGVMHSYSTAPSMQGPWTNQGNLYNLQSAPSQGSWILPIVGCKTTTYLFWRDRWGQPSDVGATIKNLDNDKARYVLQILTFNGTKIDVHEIIDLILLVDLGTGEWWVKNATPAPLPPPTTSSAPASFSPAM